MSAFTCIACRVAFADAEIQRAHYKADWHRYNLKRKVADLPAVTAENFQQRVLAQKSQLEEAEKNTSSHCKQCNKHFNSENAYKNHLQSKKHRDAEAKLAPTQQSASEAETENPHQGSGTAETEEERLAMKNAKNLALKESLSGVPEGTKPTGVTHQTLASTGKEGRTPGLAAGKAAESLKEGTVSQGSSKGDAMDVDEGGESDTESCESWDDEALSLEQCLFCSTISSSTDTNIKHMTTVHSFFIPDIEYLVNLEGLLGYLGRKVGEGHMCLWCNERGRAFLTVKATQQHMTDKGHCKMLHEGDAFFEYSDYYDYRSSYPDHQEQESGERPMQQDGEGEEEEEEEEVHPEELTEENYQLVLPSGATVGHRSLMLYYKQKLRPDRQLVLHKGTSSVSKAIAHYKSLGWTGTTGVVAQKKAKDLAFMRRIQQRHFMKLSTKANKLQHHFRDDNYGIK